MSAGNPEQLLAETDLARLQLTTLQYYLHESNPANGLVRDKTQTGAPASIAAIGLALASLPILTERGVIAREFAPELALKRLRFFRDSPHGPEPDATGYKGFYYHFLDMKSGRRVWNCELSTIDSAFLLAGMLTCAAYFDAETPEEAEVRRLADQLYARADWQWAMNEGPAVSHGWRPESGFIPHYWKGYDEALLVYILGPGHRPAFRCRPKATLRIVRPINGERSTGATCSTPGRCSHISFHTFGLTSATSETRSCAKHNSDYFENTRQATYVHQSYAMDNPRGFVGYGEHCWGITASDGPGWTKRTSHGVEREYYDYIARGAPDGPDDGTVAPWVVLASLPFAPEIVIPTINHMAQLNLGVNSRYGFKPSFNQTYKVPESPTGWWVSPYHFGIDQGPVILMIENYRSGLIWKLMRRSPYVVAGLRRAGFTGGWLEGSR